MSNAPKVTLQEVEDAITDETYTVLPDGRTTVCQLTLYNGFTVEGSSACVSIENFNAELGNKYSRQRALDEAWKVMGFRLADRLWQQTQQIKNDSNVLEMQKPPVLVQVGAQVAYVEQLDGRVSPPMAATIAGHNEDGTVNLSVLAPNGTTHVRQSVPFHYPDEPNPPENHARYW